MNIARQKGQALPIGIALILMGALATIVLFNTGQMAAEKSNLANTADAAVYSGLVWQARTLNFQAYTNRAMVANQVSMAQLVSLGSWTNYGRISAENLHTYIGWVPIIRPYTGAAVNIMTQVENVVQNAVKVAMPILGQVNSALSTIQEVSYQASYALTPEVVSSLVKANDGRYRATSTYSVGKQAVNAHAWRNLSSSYSGDDPAMQRKLALINDSRDEFSKSRSWDELPGVPKKIQVTPVDRFRIVKEGSTELINSGDQWELRGKDALSIHWEHFSCSLGSGCGWDSEELPMGWGQNYAYNSSECPSGECEAWLDENSSAEQASDENAEDLGSVYSGVAAYRSMADLSAENHDPRLVLHIEVEAPSKEIRTASRIENLGSRAAPQNPMRRGLEPGMFYTEDAYAADSMAAISAGEVFFERPVITPDDALQIAELGTVSEYANLFNPFWDVRLVEVSQFERGVAWATRDAGMAIEAAGGSAIGAARLAMQQPFGAGKVASDALADFRSLGEDALATAASGAIESAVEEAALSALEDLAANALSNMGGGFGDVISVGGNSDGNSGGSDQALSSSIAAFLGDEGSDSDLAAVLALTESIEGSDAQNVLLVSEALQQAAEGLNQQLEGLGSDIGADILASIGENFAAEIELKESLEALQSSTLESIDGYQQQVDDLSAALQSGAIDEINAQVDSLENELRSEYGDIELDRDALLNSFDGEFEALAEDLVGQSNEAVDEALGEINSAVAERFAALEINPDSVRNGVFDEAQSFVSETQASASETLTELADAATDGLTEVTEAEVEAALTEFEQTIEDTVDRYRGTVEREANTPLGAYEN